MSVLKTLTEGIVDRDLRQEGEALLNKWEKTGLLEGLDNDYTRQSMSRLLENQAKQLLKEASSMAAGDVEGFSAVAFPIVRRVFGGLIANDIVSVQPMSLPSGLIFFLDFTYNVTRFGNVADFSIYGTDKVASQITGGVNIIDDGTDGGTRTQASFGGPYLMGGTYGDSSGSCNLTCSAAQGIDFSTTSATYTDANLKLIDYDPDLCSRSGSAFGVAVYKMLKTALNSEQEEIDYDNYAAFYVQTSNNSNRLPGLVATTGIVGGNQAAANYALVRRLTGDYPDAESTHIRLVFAGPSSSTAGIDVGLVNANTTVTGTPVLNWPRKDDWATGGAIGSVVGADPWGLEGAGSTTGDFNGQNVDIIPEIDIKVDSVAVTAQTKKLKAKWSPELGQDLNAYHNLDAEVELTSILSEQIALEIDRELLADLVNGATAATRYWARSPGMFLNRTTGAEVGANTKAPDFTGTVSEWYETLVESINDVSAEIHRKTLRGGANFIVCGPEVANILEFTAGFRASVTADTAKGTIGALKTGTLSKKFEIYVDPYFLRNVVLVGRKGSSFLESGYVYAPYVPLQVTPTIFGVEDFVPRKGVMTRYAKKMVRPDMYGLVVIRGLDGESGA